MDTVSSKNDLSMCTVPPHKHCNIALPEQYSRHQVLHHFTAIHAQMFQSTQNHQTADSGSELNLLSITR